MDSRSPIGVEDEPRGNDIRARERHLLCRFVPFVANNLVSGLLFPVLRFPPFSPCAPWFKDIFVVFRVGLIWLDLAKGG